MKLFVKDSLVALFQSFSKMRILIIGDMMMDAYLWGSVNRISPEAPVPVVAVTNRNNRLGGAANVALNVKSLGATPVLCSVIGSDQRGRELIQLMDDEELTSEGIIQSERRVTTTKFRVFGNNTQMLRVDEETTASLDESESLSFHNMLINKITNENWDVVIFQDYDKGLISHDTINFAINLASEKGIPVAVDPKRKNFNLYRNVTLFKPNLGEFKEGTNTDVPVEAKDFDLIVEKYRREQNISQMLITLGSEGVFINHEGGSSKIPAHLRRVADVSGAGDTVISVAALCLAAGLSPIQTASIGNLAGGLVCEEVGVVPVNKDKLLQEAIKHLST